MNVNPRLSATSRTGANRGSVTLKESPTRANTVGCRTWTVGGAMKILLVSGLGGCCVEAVAGASIVTLASRLKRARGCISPPLMGVPRSDDQRAASYTPAQLAWLHTSEIAAFPRARWPRCGVYCGCPRADSQR